MYLNPSIHTEEIDREVRQAGLRLVYYNQRLRRLGANKRKLVCKVLQTLLTLFVFFLRLSFGLYILKSSFNLVRHVLGNIQYKDVCGEARESAAKRRKISVNYGHLQLKRLW